MPMHAQSDRLLELAMERAIEGKGDLTASIAERCLVPQSGLNEKEMSLVFDIVRILIEKVETGIRRHLAAYLAERDDVPPDLLARLVNDDISVAYPILVRSRLLQDDALVDVAARRTKQHRMAITLRPRVSETVSDALIGTRDADVIESLLYNEGAAIRQEALDGIVHDAGKVAAFHVPLVHRRDLSEDQARRLYRLVGDALRQHISAHFDVDRDLLDSALDAAVDDALCEEDLTADPAKALRAALRNGARHDVEVAFIACTGLEPAAAARILYGRSGKALAVACKASDLSLAAFSALLTRLRNGKTTVRQAGEIAGGAVAYFENLDSGRARDRLSSWRESPAAIWRDDG